MRFFFFFWDEEGEEDEEIWDEFLEELSERRSVENLAQGSERVVGETSSEAPVISILRVPLGMSLCSSMRVPRCESLLVSVRVSARVLGEISVEYAAGISEEARTQFLPARGFV